MKKVSAYVGILGLAMLVPSALRASAAGLPGATYSWGGQANGGTAADPAACLATGSLSTTGNLRSEVQGVVQEGPAQSSYTINPSAASVSASSAIAGGGIDNCYTYTDARAGSSYYFSVIAPTGSTVQYIPVVATGAASLSAFAGTSEIASVFMFADNPNLGNSSNGINFFAGRVTNRAVGLKLTRSR